MMNKSDMPLGRLKEKVALVFGGTGDIGGAIARGFCKEGAIVVPTGRNQERLNAILQELSSYDNPWTKAITTDITKEKQIKNISEKIISAYGHIDILVCASGLYLNKPAEDVTRPEWDIILETNLSGVFFACQIVGARMVQRGEGSIINIGSLGSFVALSDTIAYSVSKAGVVALTKGLSAAWSNRGVRVNNLIPGVFPTRLNKEALDKPGRKDNIIRGIPMKRLGNLDELVGAALFLASDESRYVTGISLPVDGGFLSFSGY